MAVLHFIPDSTKMQTISDLNRMFTAKIENEMNFYGVIRLAFDSYTDKSSKQAQSVKDKMGLELTTL